MNSLKIPIGILQLLTTKHTMFHTADNILFGKVQAGKTLAIIENDIPESFRNLSFLVNDDNLIDLLYPSNRKIMHLMCGSIKYKKKIIEHYTTQPIIKTELMSFDKISLQYYNQCKAIPENKFQEWTPNVTTREVSFNALNKKCIYIDSAWFECSALHFLKHVQIPFKYTVNGLPCVNNLKKLVFI